MQRRHFSLLLLLFALMNPPVSSPQRPPCVILSAAKNLFSMLSRPFAALRVTRAASGGDTEGGADLKEEKKSPAKAPSYQDDIRPLFQAKCLRCHGGKARKRDLDLSAPAGVLKGSESGAVIVPGKPEESLLYEKIIGGEMPPGKKDPLSKAEVETIRRWIAGGAKFGSD